MNAPTEEERGSALVMAIVFVTIIGLVVTLGLGYSAVSLRASAKHYAPARDRLYAADAAAKAAVRYVMANPTEGRSISGGGCKPARSYGTVRGEAVTVQVCPQGANSLTPIGGGTGWGLMTMATGSEVGVDVSGQGGLKVNGNMYANSTIKVANNSSLAVQAGDVKALGGCTGPITKDGVAVTNCTTSSAPAVDPAYTSGVTVEPDPGTGSCNGSTDVATLAPGTWTQTTLDTAIGSCDYIVMQSGVHYLEDISWSLKKRVVAGDLAVAATAIGSTPVGSACRRDTGGAMLLLGGTTQINLSGSAGTLEVCGLSVAQASKSVKLPLFGLTADIVTPGLNGTLTTTVDPTTSGSGTNWSNPARAKAVDSSYATASLARGTSSRNLDMTGFTQTAAIPSTITQLNVGVRASSNRAATVDITVLNSSGTVVCPTKSASLPSSIATTNLTLDCTTPLTKPLTVRAVVNALNSPSGTRSVQFDGVTLGYSTATRTMKAQSGCVSQVNGCAALSTQGNGNYIWLDGEVYMPKGKIDVQLPNVSQTLSTLGVVVRVLKVQAPASVAVAPTVAFENGALNNGDVTVQTSVDGQLWMTCRVTFATSGPTVVSSSMQACTIPR